MTEWRNLQLWWVVADQSGENLELLVKFCNNFCLPGFGICLWTLTEYHVIPVSKGAETSNQVIFLILRIPGGQLDHPLRCLKNYAFQGEVKALFFMTFNIIIRHIFPEHFIEIPQVVRNI